MKLFSKTFKKNWLRNIILWGTLTTIIIFLTNIFSDKPSDPEAYCPFGGLLTFGTYLAQGSMACSMTMVQIMIGIVLATGVILFSKLFCGYLCPLGWASEHLYKLREKFKLKGIQVANGCIADKILRSVKYILLLIVFYMTLTSSELFCKNFDPYYAVATGLKGEITFWMVSISLTLLFLGSFFIKMFWCKYICPLGALSNFFKFTLLFAGIILLYVVLNILFGLNIPWRYLLITACVIAYLAEIIFVRTKYFPLIKIYRKEEGCLDCGICAKKCPYNLPVDKNLVVKEVDCTLCGECISSCPTGVITFNKKKSFRWIPAILTVVLFVLALILGSIWELPTIDEKWGNESQYSSLRTMEMNGLLSVTCYGSSKTFSAKLQRVPGIYGVATFVKSHKAYIHYDPDQTNEETIRGAIYVPAKFKIASPEKSDSLIKVITIFTEKMYDATAPNYLGMQFRQHKDKKYYGIHTEFSCPLTVRLYVGLNEPINKNFLKEIVEKQELIVKGADGKENIIKLNYEFVGMGNEIDTISRREFLEMQFNKYNTYYKNNNEKFGGKDSTALLIPYPNLDKPIVSRNIPYLSSYLSLTDGVLRMETYLNEKDTPEFKIVYVPSVISEEELWGTLQQKTWKIRMKDESIKEMDAKIEFNK
jgi:polyferredoxin